MLKSTKKMKNHVCSNCFEEFPSKDVFIALKNNYSTLYCRDCLKTLNIDEFETYLKSKKGKKD